MTLRLAVTLALTLTLVDRMRLHVDCGDIDGNIVACLSRASLLGRCESTHLLTSLVLWTKKEK